MIFEDSLEEEIPDSSDEDYDSDSEYSGSETGDTGNVHITQLVQQAIS